MNDLPPQIGCAIKLPRIIGIPKVKPIVYKFQKFKAFIIIARGAENIKNKTIVYIN